MGHDDEDMTDLPEYVDTELETVYEDFPQLRERFTLICRVGDGTFSAVYKASLKEDPTKFVALKRIYTLSAPSRVLSEVHFLQTLGGRHNVVGVLEGIRSRDQIILVLEYVNFTDFKVIIRDPSLDLICCYMSQLFEALAYTQAKGVVHRDVKPANFLFDMATGRAVLVDFGLAQSLKELTGRSTPQAPRKRHAGDNEPVRTTPSIAHLAKLKPTMTHIPGDRRSRMKAPRAGTRGFRAPEVLLRNPRQSEALDVWSAGVILLSMITGRYPFFLSTDDNVGLWELCLTLGPVKMQEAAAAGERRISFVDVQPPQHIRPNHTVDWRQFCERLRPSIAGRFPDSIYAFLDRCLDPVASRRLRAIDAFNEPFLQIPWKYPPPEPCTPTDTPSAPREMSAPEPVS